MSLDNILTALDSAINNKLAELDNSLLKDPEVKETLTRFFVEKDVRSKLLEAIKIPELMHDYLRLPEEIKIEFEEFRRKNLGFFEGNEAKGIPQYIKATKNKKFRVIAKKILWTNQLIKLFYFFFKKQKIKKKKKKKKEKKKHI